MLAPRRLLTAAGLSFLLCGCGTTEQQAPEVADLSQQASWEILDGPGTTRGYATATLLTSGRVLIVGGIGSSSDFSTDEVDLYDPLTHQFSATGSLSDGRRHASSTLLLDGRVLVVGGCVTAGTTCDTALASAEIYDPATGTWSPTGSLADARWGHTATRLRDGRVLIAGGVDETNVTNRFAEVFDPAAAGGTGAFSSPGGTMRAGRYLHTANMLPSGQVLFVGGATASSKQSAERFDPMLAGGLGAFVDTAGAPVFAHVAHIGTQLSSGEVVFGTGCGDSCTPPVTEADRYDPATDEFVAAGTYTPRRFTQGSALPSGKVAWIGGVTPSNTAESAVEVYDLTANAGAGGFVSALPLQEGRGSQPTVLLPTSRVLVAGIHTSVRSSELFDPHGGGTHGRWESVANLTAALEGPGVTPLVDGRIVITGGLQSSGIPSTAVAVFDPDTDTVSNVGTLLQPRWLHEATLLIDGRVLVSGGCSDAGCSNLLDSTEVLEPATATVSAGPSLGTARTRHRATRLVSGEVLITGGCSSSDCSTVFDSAEQIDRQATATLALPVLEQPRGRHTATRLSDGRVLLVGGSVTPAAELFDPRTRIFSAVSPPAAARSSHVATLLPTGQVLIAGGEGQASAELYDPDFASFSATAALAQTRERATATLLPNGKVLIAGGCVTHQGTCVAPTASEIFDPVPKQFTPVGAPQGFGSHTRASLLPDGRVVFLGAGSSVEVWDETCPVAGSGDDCDRSLMDVFRPDLDALAASVTLRSTAAITGSRLGGVTQGHAGFTDSSPSDVPIALWMPLQGGPLQLGGVSEWSSTAATWTVPTTIHPGPGWLFVVALGNPSRARGTLVEALVDGTNCGSATECASGHCVDGVCCDRGCDGECEACVGALSGGSDGQCSPITGGTDPDDECSAEAPDTCGLDGACDGAGACRLHPAGTECAAPSCSGSQLEPASTCDGAGSCDAPAVESCSPYVCASATACSTTCASDDDCADGARCEAQACVSRGENGDPCGSGNECQSGFCVDGVCCDGPCGGVCEACAEAGLEGVCAPVAGQPRGDRPTCPEATDTEPCAAAACDGETRDRCDAFVDDSVVCQPARCEAGVATSAASCDGQGACGAAVTTDCSPYACFGDECGQRCDDDDDCVGEFRCVGAECVTGARCLDEFTLSEADGTEVSCVPHRCDGASCQPSCDIDDDCAPGFSCIAATCTLPSDESNQDSGCGCRVESRDQAPDALWWLALALSVLARRRWL